MQAYTRQKLIKDGVREDSVFFEYIGRMRDLSNLAASVLDKSTGKEGFENSSNDVFNLILDLIKIREDHYYFLKEKRAPLDIPEILIDGNTYADTAEKLDKEIEYGLNELKFSLNNNIASLETFDQLKYKLLGLKKMDQRLYERATARINSIFDKAYSVTTPKHRSSHTISTPYSQPTQNFYYSGPRPNPNIPDHITAYVQRLQPIKPHSDYNANIRPPQPPVMHQSGPNPIPARQRKKEKDEKKQNGKKHTLRNVIILVSVLGIAQLCAPGQSVDPPEQTKATLPPQSPGIVETGAMPSATEIPISLPTEVASTVDISNTAQTATVAPRATHVASPKYDKGTLMYWLEYMDDAMVSVVANSLRNSINNCNELQLKMYGNGCNMKFETDREFVAYVFSIIDARVKEMKAHGNSPDRFAIALQMEQLSGDVAKYLISKSIGDSGKYKRDNYSAEDIDFYYSISGGKTKAFDVRTLKTVNGRLVQDEVIGRSVHFSGDMKSLINSHCTLNAAIEGNGTEDLLTGESTLCAFGTQEGTIINDTSLDTYKVLVRVFRGEYELKVGAPGKGVKIVYHQTHER